MSSSESQTVPSFDDDASRVLRQAGRLADRGRVGLAHLRQALERPSAGPLPPAILRLDERARWVIDWARRLAAKGRAAHVARAHLAEALVEVEARLAGPYDLAPPELDRLRRARQRAQDLYGDAPYRRRHLEGPLWRT